MGILLIIMLSLVFAVVVIGVLLRYDYNATVKEYEESDTNDYSHYFKNRLN